MTQNNERNSTIIKYNLIGITVNLLMSALKLIAGFLAHSHAVMLDGIDSLSDTFASIISIMSAKIGSRRGDKAHPLGYGRLEYLGSMAVTVVLMYISVISIIDSFRAIINPHQAPEYTRLIVILMLTSLVFKIGYGIIMWVQGKKLDCISMKMAGTDSIADALTSVGILAAILIYKTTGKDIEHYVCLLISLFIIKTGIDMLRECLTKLLGTRPDPELKREIDETIAQEEEVLNVSNLIIHSYGEGNYVGSVDIEVDENLTAAHISRLSRRIIRRAKDFGVILTSVGISGTNISDAETAAVLDSIIDIAREHKSVKRVQSFIMDKEEKEISFYIVPNYSEKNRDEDIEAFCSEVEKAYSDMHMEIQLAIDM